MAFFGLAAEWFWERWFATGLGNFGSVFLLLMLQMGFEPILAFFGGTHAAVTLLLMGDGMAARYEHSEHTKERWNFQDESLVLMRRAFKSAGSTLPLLVLYFFAPKPEFLQLGVLALGGVAALGLFRGKTWGLAAIGGVALVALGHALLGGPTALAVAPAHPLAAPWAALAGSGGLAWGAALTGLIPLSLAPAVARWLRRA